MAPPRSIARFKARVLEGSKVGEYPGFVKPQLAKLQRQVPAGDRWIHEIKFDGFRIQAHLVKSRVHLYTRSGLDWTARFEPVAEGIGRLKANHAILDGEIVSEVDGRPSFSTLQNDLTTGRTDRMVYYAFDLLFLDGFDIRAATLIDRKSVLADVLTENKPPHVLYSEHWEKDGEKIYRHACAMKLEGTISKLRNAPYRSERSDAWIKNKCVQRDTFVIVGFIPEAGRHIAALRLAKRKGKALHYVGKAGTGFTRLSSQALRKKLDPLARATPPVVEKLRKKDTTWVEPQLSAQIEYTEFTADGTLRHPSYKGLAS